MALVWAHGFETGADYQVYQNDQSDETVMANEGWRLVCTDLGAPPRSHKLR